MPRSVLIRQVCGVFRVEIVPRCTPPEAPTAFESHESAAARAEQIVRTAARAGENLAIKDWTIAGRERELDGLFKQLSASRGR